MSLKLYQETHSPLTLSNQTLGVIREKFDCKKYDRQNLNAGILHMSVGGFHRSHQALYVDDCLAKEPQNWMIQGVGLMPQDLDHAKALNAQDGLYAVLERSPASDHVRIISSLKSMLHGPSQIGDVIDSIASSAIRIISLTITEKGYCYDSQQNLDLANPLVKSDIETIKSSNPSPKTALGFLALGLQKRRQSNSGPVTIMCCDNLPGNGHITHKILSQFVDLYDKSLTDWIHQNCSFPNAMVDRITPVTTEAVKALLENEYDLQDQWPVVCEDFRQWIIEDNFIAGRPCFEKVGVQIVANVDPYEKMKVRLLNGSHSALSYLSYLSGFRAVDQAMQDPIIRKFVRGYMDHDITPSVPDVAGIDLNQYKDTLINRFSNSSISDQIQRLAEDGSQKIKNAIVPPLMFQLERKASTKYIAMAMAGWFRYLRGIDEQSEAIAIKDPMKDHLQNLARLTPQDPTGFFNVQDIFGPYLAGHPQFINQVKTYLTSFEEKGVYETVREFLS
jgi:mannitol 2-dehydrogenase